MTLRKAAVSAALGVWLVSLVACVALVVFTTMLRNTTDQLIHVGRQWSVIDELESNVMLNVFEDTPSARAISEARGRALLVRVDEVTSSPAERMPFVRLIPLLNSLWKSPATPNMALSRELMIELARTEEYLARNVRFMQARAARLDTVSNFVGVGLALLMISSVVFAMWWLRYFMSRPLQRLAASVDRFSAGELAVRAEERGVDELRMLARTHNEMADAVSRTRLDQLHYIATVVHDLRNPLAAVQLAVGFVEPGVPLPPEPRIRELFVVIQRQLTRMNSIVGDVLGAVQVDAGVMVLREEDVDLDRVARRSLELFQSASLAHRFIYQAHGPTMVLGDEDRIEQVINNLVSNAVKYSPRGTPITLELRGSPDGVLIEVTDEGPGIDPVQLAQLFRPFFRGKQVHEQIAGVGLGLYVSRKIVEAHHGTIDVKSILGKGTTIKVFLPRRARP